MNALFKLIMCWDLKVRQSQRGFKLQKSYCSYRNMFLLPDLGPFCQLTISPIAPSSFSIDDHKLVHLSSFVYFRPHLEELRRIMEMKTAHYLQGIKIDHSLCQFEK